MLFFDAAEVLLWLRGTDCDEGRMEVEPIASPVLACDKLKVAPQSFFGLVIDHIHQIGHALFQIVLTDQNFRVDILLVEGDRLIQFELPSWRESA